jgi:hypothetical protein
MGMIMPSAKAGRKNAKTIHSTLKRPKTLRITSPSKKYIRRRASLGFAGVLDLFALSNPD